MMIEFLVLHVNVTGLLLQGFECAIPGNGEEPLRQMTLDGGLLMLVHPHERLLHRVACAVEVLQDALGILQERTLKPLKSGLNPRCLLFCFGGKHWGERPELHICTGIQRLVFCI